MDLKFELGKVKYNEFEDEASPKGNTKEEINHKNQPNIFEVENGDFRQKQRRSSKPELLDARNLFPFKLNKTFTNSKKKEEIEDGEISSVISLSTSSTDKDKEKIYRIFLICWFLHSIYGLITLVVDYSDKDNNPDAYYLVLFLTFKWMISAIATFVIAFGIYVFCKLFLKDKNFGEYIGAIYMVFSGLSSVIIVLAIPFGIRALYISNNLQFMILLYIQIEIILDVIVVCEVLWTLFFASNSKSKYSLFQNEEEKGIKSILSDGNLERLQKEILGAYQKNEILKFEKYQSNKESSPEYTNSEKEDKKDERLSVFPISELEGEQHLSFEQGSTIRKDSKPSSKNASFFLQGRGRENSVQSKPNTKYQAEFKIQEEKDEEHYDERDLKTISIKEQL